MYAAVQECLFQSRQVHTALATFTAEASLLAGTNLQPTIPAHYFHGPGAFGRRLDLKARGVLGSTGTPTYLFQWRANTTVGSTNLAGDSIGVSAALTTQSGVTNQWWEANLSIVVLTPGQGDNCSLQCSGSIRSPGGLSLPYEYSFAPTTPPTATWTATIDSTVAHYINFSVTCSASSGSNTIQCLDLMMQGPN